MMFYRYIALFSEISKNLTKVVTYTACLSPHVKHHKTYERRRRHDQAVRLTCSFRICSRSKKGDARNYLNVPNCDQHLKLRSFNFSNTISWIPYSSPSLMFENRRLRSSLAAGPTSFTWMAKNTGRRPTSTLSFIAPWTFWPSG